ncbi:transposase [Rhizobium mesosinicum]|uniref:Transposase n=1 Tax=Rhizobium mesosinicum TaxID=335017 RepID=A0ABS7GNQ7_9HYPH|nr:transposase [Rhizobium mesosinicum]
MIEAVPDRLDGAPRQLRRFWSDEFKATAVEQACQPCVNVSAVARQIGILPSQLYRWRRELLGSDEPGKQRRKSIRRALYPAPTPSWTSSLAMLSCGQAGMSTRLICSALSERFVRHDPRGCKGVPRQPSHRLPQRTGQLAVAGARRRQ